MATLLSQTVDPGGTGDYTSLFNWEAQNLDLGALNKYCICTCICTNGAADTTTCQISGWSVDATRFIKVTVGAGYRHAGKYATGNIYRIEVTDGSLVGISNQGFTQLDGLLGKMTRSGTTDSWGFSSGHWQDNQANKISNCCVMGNDASSGNCRAGYNFSGGTIQAWNCIAYGFSTGYNSWGVLANCSGTVSLYNFTIYNCKAGYESSNTNAGVTLKNFAIFGCVTDFRDLNSETVDHCASDDGTGTNAQHFTSGATDWAKVFTDYANGDFSLKNYTTSPCCVGVGIDDPGSGLYSDDIIGTTRTSVWDIGAFEYETGGGAETITMEKWFLMGLNPVLPRPEIIAY